MRKEGKQEMKLDEDEKNLHYDGEVISGCLNFMALKKKREIE